MKLTIIVPVFNQAKDDKLIHCLDSLINQSIDDYEILAVDDCSTDDSLSIMKQYESDYPDKFVAIHSDVNKHQGGAKNIALKKAKGDWIGFIDADDWITPDYYEKLITKAEETGADIVGCDLSLVDEYTFKPGKIVKESRKDQVGNLDHEKRVSMILDSGALVTKIFRRQFILDNDLFFPEHIFYEDNALGNSYMILNKHYEYIEEPMYFYYQHDSSTVHTISVKRCEDRMAAARIMIDEAKRHGFYNEFEEELEYNFSVLFYVNTLFTYMAGVERKRISWVKALGQEMKSTFPEFQANNYYQSRTHEEEKKLVKMQQKSTLYFMMYYKLLWTYRNILKKIRNR